MNDVKSVKEELEGLKKEIDLFIVHPEKISKGKLMEISSNIDRLITDFGSNNIN